MNQVVHTVEITLRSLKNSEEAEISRQVETLVETMHEMIANEEKWQQIALESPSLIRKQLQNPSEVALNWGLVSLFARFESLLEHLLLLYFRKDNRAFLNWSTDTAMTFDQIKEVSSIDAVKDKYFRKAIKGFTEKSITKRVELLSKNLNVRPEILFSQRHMNDRIKSAVGANWGATTLEDVSNKRNEIVHRQALPLMNTAELETAEIVLERFLFNVALIIGTKLDMPVMAYGILLPQLR